MRTWLAFLLVVLAPVTTAAPLLVAVVPDLPGSSSGDDGFAVGCAQACDLTGWQATDGESTWGFPAGTTLEWVIEGNAARVIPIPADPIKAFRGSGPKGQVQHLLKERQRDRRKENGR